MLIGDIYEKDELCTFVQKGKIVKKTTCRKDSLVIDYGQVIFGISAPGPLITQV